MSEYEFDAVRWCDSMKKAHFARKDFVTAENFKQTRMRIEELEACVAELKNMFDDAMQTNHFLEGGISALRARVARLEEAGKNILRKIPNTKNDYSGVGYCFGCGVVKWVSGGNGYKEECKPDCAMQAFRRALEEK